MRYSAVIFDLDGTVLDTLGDLHSSVCFALEKNSMPQRTVDEVRHFVGNGIANLIKRSTPDGTDDDRDGKVLGDFIKHYTEHCNDTTSPYDGIPKLLQFLSEKGIKTAVLSNKSDFAVKALCELHFGNLFDYVAGEKENVRRKPYPDGVFAALEELGVEKENAVYVGDSEVDVETARNAGIDLIAVDWGFRGRDVLLTAGAKLIVSTPQQLLENL